MEWDENEPQVCDLCNKSFYITKKDDLGSHPLNNHYIVVCAGCFEELCRCFRIEILYG